MAVSMFFILIFRAALALILSRSFVLAHARLLLQSAPSTPAIQQILFGTVFCDACLENKLTSNSIPLRDAKLRLECKNNLGQPDFSTLLLANETGQFTAHLPTNLNLSACSARFLSSHHLQSCNISSSSSSSSPSAFSIPLTTSHVNFAIKPSKIFTFCPRSEALSLGPPDPQVPSSSSSFSVSKVSKKKEPDSYHLGPPDPPRPTGVVTTSYRLGPPNPPQPRVHN